MSRARAFRPRVATAGEPMNPKPPEPPNPRTPEPSSPRTSEPWKPRTREPLNPRNAIPRPALTLFVVVSIGLTSIRAAAGPEVDTVRSTVSTLVELFRSGLAYDGRLIDAVEFFTPHEGGNGRSCATCHRPEDHFGLTPATVEVRYQQWQARLRVDPTADDPLFRSIDADDFDRDFTTLRTKALVRVTLPLPSNVTLAEDPNARTVSVWRSVPTVMNAALTAPFQSEGRLITLADQAHSAMQAHSEVTTPASDRVIRRFVSFQEHLFSSKRVRRLARRSPTAVSHEGAELSSLERQGKATFEEFCSKCHGGLTQTVNTEARFLTVPQRGPLPGPQAFVNVFVQTPRVPPFFDGLPTAGLPERLYVVTMPDGSTRNVTTSDPGRALITGDFREFGRFDIPTLFGIGHTAPYFHDNSAQTLEDVIRHYQALFNLLTVFANQGLLAPAINGQGCDAATCGFRPLPDDEVPGLLAFIKSL